MRAAHVYNGSRYQGWATPDDLYAELHAEFGFMLDPSHPSRFNGLTESWAGQRVYCNPPYKDIAPWLAKAREAALAVYLLPARTGTEWWHTYAMTANEIRFMRGRLRFEGSPINAPFDSCVLVYNDIMGPQRITSWRRLRPSAPAGEDDRGRQRDRGGVGAPGLFLLAPLRG